MRPGLLLIVVVRALHGPVFGPQPMGRVILQWYSAGRARCGPETFSIVNIIYNIIEHCFVVFGQDNGLACGLGPGLKYDNCVAGRNKLFMGRDLIIKFACLARSAPLLRACAAKFVLYSKFPRSRYLVWGFASLGLAFGLA